MKKSKREKDYDAEDGLGAADLMRPDKHDLDNELVIQPELAYEYGVRLADARAKVDEYKAEVDVIEAELELDIRNNPKGYDLPKVTDAIVKAAVRAQSQYQEAVKQLNKARHAAGVLDAAVTAIEHRKKSLENLCFLWGQQYFGEPRIKDARTREELDRAMKKSVRSKGIKQRDDDE